MSREKAKQTAGVPSGLRDGQFGVDTSTEELYFKPDSAAQFKITSPASVAWGDITGTLSSQTDLQSALNGKANSSHTHDAADIVSGTLVAARLPVFVGDSGAGGTQGAVPAPAAGDAAAEKFLHADGTWKVPAGGGGGGLERYNVEQSGLEVEVLATGTGITHTRSGNKGTFNVPAGVRLISAKLRLQGGTDTTFGEHVIAVNTVDDMGNSALTDLWQPIVDAWSEATPSNRRNIGVAFSTSTFGEFTVTNLDDSNINAVRLSF